MSKTSSNITKTWIALEKNRDALAKLSLQKLFDADPDRFNKFSIKFNGITVDFSKQRIDQKTLSLLKDLTKERQLKSKIQDLYQGKTVNVSENRAAMHVALRDKTDRRYCINGSNIAIDIKTTLNRMLDFSDSVREGRTKGISGDRFNKVIIIGVGGSVNGTEFCCEALKLQKTTEIQFHFVTSLDNTALQDALFNSKPETTLFVIVSKTFSTEDTHTNAIHARQWIENHLGKKAIQHHFAAITEKHSAAREFGVSNKHLFPIWDWVGGRFSTCSAVGLPIALAHGSEAFREFLHGAHSMDKHFEVSPPEKNLPIILALIDLWNRNFWATPVLAILPYDYRLRFLPTFVQALIMESNGKSSKFNIRKGQYETAPVVFGKLGSEAQHSFMQLLHQSPMTVASEFVIAMTNEHDSERDRLISNMVAQSRTLMCGVSYPELQPTNHPDIASHKVCPGNKPSTAILLNSISPSTLGSLIALYEHRAFVGGMLWGLNPFDQWGVELGKNISSNILAHISNKRTLANTDSSTVGIINAYLEKKTENKL